MLEKNYKIILGHSVDYRTGMTWADVWPHVSAARFAHTTTHFLLPSPHVSIQPRHGSVGAAHLARPRCTFLSPLDGVSEDMHMHLDAPHRRHRPHPLLAPRMHQFVASTGQQGTQITFRTASPCGEGVLLTFGATQSWSVRSHRTSPVR